MAQVSGSASSGLTQAQVDARIAAAVSALSIPVASTAAPSAEATAAMPGTSTARFAQEGHQHPRLTSTTMATLGSDATATIVFTRSFTAKPGVVLTEVDSTSSQPLVCVVTAFQQSAGVYTGCTIKGYRSQALPSQTQLSVASLLTAVITGVNNLVASLTGFNIFGGSAAGANISVVAIARSDV